MLSKVLRNSMLWLWMVLQAIHYLCRYWWAPSTIPQIPGQSPNLHSKFSTLSMTKGTNEPALFLSPWISNVTPPSLLAKCLTWRTMELFRRKERRGGEFKLDSKGPCPIYSALSFILSLCAIDSLAFAADSRRCDKMHACHCVRFSI